MQTVERQRAKLFQRSVTEARDLTPRELALMNHVRRYRLVSSADLALLDGGSHQNVLRILRDLFDLGLLERPKAQVANWIDGGARPMIYGLSNKGARLLRLYEDEGDLSENNRRAGAVFVHHTAEIASFMVRLEVACRSQGHISLLTREDILDNAPAKTRMMREPLRLRMPTSAAGKRTASVIPDEFFGLAYPNDTAAYFFLELDRGTMPIVRKGSDRTSFARKLSTYWQAWKAGKYAEQFGVKHVRVLTVAPSRERVATMIEATRAITNGSGSGLFLFVDRETFCRSDALATEFVNAKRETVRLLD